jgi:hypothetical protein
MPVWAGRTKNGDERHETERCYNFPDWECGLTTIVAKNKRKPSKFTAAREARRRARELAGPPPAQRVIPDKRRKPSKHKKNLLDDSGQ